jgi:hypothetical protein
VASWLPSAPSWALTDSENVGISAVMPLRAELSMIRDLNSVTRGVVGTVLFDRYDDDPVASGGQPNPNPLFMYAPYRAEVGKNWHLASIIANGSSMTLTADVTGSAGPTPLAEILDVFCGGFFEPFPPPNEKGGASTDWELLDTFERIFTEPLTATAPFNYRLRLRGVVAGTHSGNILYTVVSTI